MEYILGFGALYMLAEKHSTRTDMEERYARMAYKEGSGGPPLDPTGYYRDDHLEGRRQFGEEVDLAVARKIGATTASGDIFNRWTVSEVGLFNPALNERRYFQEDFVRDVPNGWDKWWGRILREVEMREKARS